MHYPDIWDEGIILAFSGLEGETNFSHPLIAGTLKEFGNFILRFGDGIDFGFQNLNMHRKIEPVIVSSDLIVAKKPKISIVFVENDSIAGDYSETFIPFLKHSKRSAIRKYQVFSLFVQEGVIILTIDPKKKKFFLVYDPESQENATKRSISQLEKLSITKEVNRKLKFFEKVHLPKFKNEIEERTYLKAISIMKVNCESAQGKIKHIWTTPDRWPHKYMWFWDSAFHTFGNFFISSHLAENTLSAVISCQREDGFISITMNPEKGRVYENLTQPPLFAWAGYELFKKTGNKDFLETLYISISKYINWLYKNRDRDKDGLLEWVVDENDVSKCGECGMDNSPRFDEIKPDEPVAAIDLNCYAINEMEHLSKIAEILKREQESLIWKVLANEKKKMVDTFLWNEKDGFFYDKRQNGNFIKIKTPASLLPLFAGIPQHDKARILIKKIKEKNLFWTDFPLPSVSKDEKSFCKDMWRGGVWLNFNFMIYKGLLRYGFKTLAEQLAQKIKINVEKWYIKKGSIFEFYDPDNKIPPKQLPRKDWLGKKGWTRTISDYQWSASVYVAILNELRRDKNGKY
ncbi:MAG: trehalase family glycosidase [bacterium]|nr:trehalase family glycosidase [bacterium]